MHVTLKKQNKKQYIPTSPVLSPHFRTIGIVRGELITIPSIASINLYQKKITVNKIKKIYIFKKRALLLYI
jgi:hypothetical protein